MANSNSHIFVALFIVILLIAAIWYLNKNDNLIHNEGTIDSITNKNLMTVPHDQMYINSNAIKSKGTTGPMRNTADISDNIVDDLVSQYNNKSPSAVDCNIYSPSDPMSSEYGPFVGYGKKRQLDFRKTQYPYSDEDDERDFTYKKKQFTKRTPEDVEDLFDVHKMLPQEIEEDWFDTVPLQHTKKIKGTQLVHPKVHMGVNTIGSSLRNGTHDIRGDIPNPKIRVSIFNNSTIEPDTNIKGLCNS